MSELQFAFYTLEPFIMLAVVIGVVLGIVVGFAKVGYKLAPYIVIATLIYWFLSAMQFAVDFL